jgi:N-acetylmuramoyl-L-alanine amidase
LTTVGKNAINYIMRFILIALMVEFGGLNMNVDDLFWLSYCVYCEARGEVQEGQKAVAKVILNRGGGKGIQEVVLKPQQFSSFNDGLRPVVEEAITFLAVMGTVNSAYEEWLGGDDLEKAKFYHNPKKCEPKWAIGMIEVAVIGNHRFLR